MDEDDEGATKWNEEVLSQGLKSEFSTTESKNQSNEN
jgi:hypothetical protein